MIWKTLIGIAVGIGLVWVALITALWVTKPESGRLRETLRLLPDVLRLLKRLSSDRTMERGVRVRLWLLFGYLALPIDLIPDFIPVIGYADDAIIVALVLRGVVKRAGAGSVAQHWPGTTDGLSALWRAAQLPGEPPRASAHD